MEERLVDFKKLMKVFKKNIIFLLIPILALGILGALKAFRMKPIYEARATIFVDQSQMKYKSEDEETSSLGYSKEQLENYANLTNISIKLMKTEDFMTKVIDEADLDVKPQELLNSLIFKVENGAPIIELSYSDGNEKNSSNVVNAVINQFSVGAGEILSNANTTVIDSVKVKVNTPNKIKVILVFLVIGIVIGIGLVLVKDYLDDSVTDIEDLEAIVPVPVIGKIPVEKIKTKK